MLLVLVQSPALALADALSLCHAKTGKIIALTVRNFPPIPFHDAARKRVASVATLDHFYSSGTSQAHGQDTQDKNSRR